MTWFFKNKKNPEMVTPVELSEVDCSNHPLKLRETPALITMIAHGVTISLLFGFAFYVKHEITIIKQCSQVSIEREAEILSELSDLKSQIAVIQADHQQIAELKDDLIQLQHTAATEQSLDNLVKKTDLKLITDQLAQLKKSVNINKSPFCPVAKSHAAQRLSTVYPALPFKVESLDRMAGQSFASVIYHQDTIPVLLNESIAGWKAVKMNVDAGIVVWENAEKNHHRIKITASRGLYV